MSVPLPTPEGPHNTTICDPEDGGVGGVGGVIDCTFWARCSIEKMKVNDTKPFFLRQHQVCIRCSPAPTQQHVPSTYLDIGFQNSLELAETIVQVVVDQNGIEKTVLRNTHQTCVFARALYTSLCLSSAHTIPPKPQSFINVLLHRMLRSLLERSSVSFSATPASSINPLSIATILYQPTVRTTQHSLTNPCISDSALPLSPCCDHVDALRGFQSMEAE